MKAMHVRVVAVLVLWCVACGRAEAFRDEDMDVSALTRRDPVVEPVQTDVALEGHGGWVWPGASTNESALTRTGKVAVAINLPSGARAIPEPSAILLVCVGLLSMVAIGRRPR